jgi:Putative prokaryotic signal transducing protein
MVAEDLRVVTTVGNEAEAEMVGEWLTEAGIRSMPQMNSNGIRLGAAAGRDIYVGAEDYDRAVEVVNAEVPSEAELEALSQHPKQPTRPAEGDPVEIPVPKREDIENLLNRAAQPIDRKPDA